MIVIMVGPAAPNVNAGYNPTDVASITRISISRRRPNWLRVYIDGEFAFSCKAAVAARFELRAGAQLDDIQVARIKHGEVEQECRDAALAFLSRRLHSRAELRRKLARKEFDAETIESALNDLTRMGYLDDQRFAATRTRSAAQHRHQGRQRAFMELLKTGVSAELAQRAVEDVYSQTDSVALARDLAQKKMASLKRLEAPVARRRLIGLLQRRGFDYETIKPIIDEMFGNELES